MKELKFILFLFGAGSILFLMSCNKDEKVEHIIERGSVTDVEGNVYQTVKIGEQWWMAENLRSTKFNDGTDLNMFDNTLPDSAWADLLDATYFALNDARFGLIYNGLVVESDKNIAPPGWHIPNDQDWKKMEGAIGMPESDLNQTAWRGENEAEKLTSKYSANWPDGGMLFGSDEFGFNALPGGCRIADGRINIYSNTAFWWTSSELDGELWYRYIDAMDKKIFRHHTNPQYGMSIRCVKD